MLLSRGCEYGLRASLFLAAQPADRHVPIREISTRLDISFHFLTKVLQSLTAVGMLNSYRGANGGVALAVSPREIRLIDIVKAIEGRDMLRECLLGLPECDRNQMCRLEGRWVQTRECLREMFLETTLEELRTQLDPGDVGQKAPSDRKSVTD